MTLLEAHTAHVCTGYVTKRERERRYQAALLPNQTLVRLSVAWGADRPHHGAHFPLQLCRFVTFQVQVSSLFEGLILGVPVVFRPSLETVSKINLNLNLCMYDPRL